MKVLWMRPAPLFVVFCQQTSTVICRRLSVAVSITSLHWKPPTHMSFPIFDTRSWFSVLQEPDPFQRVSSVSWYCPRRKWLTVLQRVACFHADSLAGSASTDENSCLETGGCHERRLWHFTSIDFTATEWHFICQESLCAYSSLLQVFGVVVFADSDSDSGVCGWI